MAAAITHAAIGAAASGLATAAIHQAALDQATIAGIDQSNLDSITKAIQVGTPALTTDGATRWNTTSLVASKGPSRRLQSYDSTATAIIDFAEAYYSASTPASAYQIVGLLWRDMTLHIWRRWEDATTAPNGEPGWHPIDSAYQLWKNESGGTVAATKVVVHKAGGTNDVRAFTTTTTVKDQTVAGVTMESIADTAYGVVAMVSGGTQVNVLCDDAAADGAVAKGDFLCSYSVAGEARTVGPQTASGSLGSGNYTIGTPMGAFAVALGTKDGATHLVKAKLLGFVGAGAQAFQDSTSFNLWTDTTPASQSNIDASVRSNGNASQGAVSAVINTKHLPLVAVDLTLRGEATATGTNARAAFTFSGTQAERSLAFIGNGAGSGYYGGIISTGYIPLDVANNQFDLTVSLSDTSATFTSFTLSLPSYIY